MEEEEERENGKKKKKNDIPVCMKEKEEMIICDFDFSFGLSGKSSFSPSFSLCPFVNSLSA